MHFVFLRCECFGHASSFQYVEGSGGQIGRCVCNCESSTNTEGENVSCFNLHLILDLLHSM